MQVFIDGCRVECENINIQYEHVEDGKLSYTFLPDGRMSVSVIEDGNPVFSQQSTLDEEVDRIVKLME